MKNRWLKVIAFAFAFIFTVSLGAFKAVPMMADEETADEGMSDEADELKKLLSNLLEEFKTKAEIDEFLDENTAQYESYYSEEEIEEMKSTYKFLYDWIDIKKEIGEIDKITDFTYEEDKETLEITSATMSIKCKDGDAVLNYAITDGKVNVTIEKKATFGDLMIKAALNTLLGMGTVFVVLIFICIIISCFKFIHKEEKQETVVKPVETVVAVEEPEEDVTDDLELVAVISAAIAAAEGTSAEGFQVRSIKRVRRAN